MKSSHNKFSLLCNIRILQLSVLAVCTLSCPSASHPPSPCLAPQCNLDICFANAGNIRTFFRNNLPGRRIAETIADPLSAATDWRLSISIRKLSEWPDLCADVCALASDEVPALYGLPPNDLHSTLKDDVRPVLTRKIIGCDVTFHSSSRALRGPLCLGRASVQLDRCCTGFERSACATPSVGSRLTCHLSMCHYRRNKVANRLHLSTASLECVASLLARSVPRVQSLNSAMFSRVAT